MPINHRSTFLGTALALSFVLAAPARAQDQRAQARQLFEQGVSAMDSSNPALASQRFQESYRLFPRASTACNMALSLERTSRGCEAMNWYRQCAALDTAGQFRDHANRQAAALSQQCSNGPQAPNPFVSGPEAGGTVQVVESGQPERWVVPRNYDHTMLGVGIPALLLGIGGFVGGGLAAQAATDEAALIGVDPGTAMNPVLLPDDTEAANRYNQATLLSNVAIGLYVTGGILSAIGALLIVIDLGRPGVFGDESARSSGGATLAIGGRPEGGAVGQLTLSF